MEVRCGGLPGTLSGDGQESGRPSKTVGAHANALNRRKPTQMAIPLKMDLKISKNSWSLQERRAGRRKPDGTFEGVDLESESQ
jgi:hypothetical protein